MKKPIISLFFFLYTLSSFAQQSLIDSINKRINNTEDIVEKTRALNDLSDVYERSKPDLAIIAMQQSLSLSKKIAASQQEYKFEYYALERIALLLLDVGNYPKAFDYYIELLKLAEKNNNYLKMATANISIGRVLQRQQEYQKALVYCNKADSIISLYNLEDLKAASLGNFGNIYFKLGKTDSALFYTSNYYGLSKQKNDAYLTGVSLNNLGNIYAETGNTLAAFNNYKEAILYSATANDLDNICESSLGLASLFNKQGLKDSVLYYAGNALKIATENGFTERQMQASLFLTAYYQKLPNIDSAFAYQQQMIAAKDSVNSNEKIKQFLVISIDEELRQQERSENIKREKEERNKTLQLLAVGTFMPTIFLSVLFIRRKKINPGVIKFCGIVSLLMFFECITLLLHPFVVNVSGHVPLIELMIFVCVAAIIIPTHHRIEHWLISLLTHHKTNHPH